MKIREKLKELMGYLGNIRERRRLAKRISGHNIKVIAIKDGKEYNIWSTSKNFRINGDNNTIIFRCDKIKNVIRTLPKSLQVYIDGNNNLIDMELPLGDFSNVCIGMKRDNNVFEIKSTYRGFSNVSVGCEDAGQVRIGKDCSIRTGENHFFSGGGYNEPVKIIIGDGVMVARETIFRNSSGETMLDSETDMPIAKPKDIVIGNHVWIMSRCMVYAGCQLPEGTAVAACSFVNKKFEEKNTLIGGTPARVIRRGIKWAPGSYIEHMNAWLRKGKMDNGETNR